MKSPFILSRWFLGCMLSVTLLCWCLPLRAQDEGGDTKPAKKKPFRINGDSEKGRVVFRLLCVTCHGERGDGEGISGRELGIDMPDFTDPEHMLAIEDKDLFQTVREGGISVGKSGIMHSWKSNLNDQQIHDVLSYVRLFARPMAKTVLPDDSAAYD